MSAVVKAIQSVANVVLDVVEAVGEVVVDVVDTVVETVEYVAKNPEIIVIAVAAPQLLPYIGITGAAIAPVTAGLISASQGGDLEDIGKAALTAMLLPKSAQRLVALLPLLLLALLYKTHWPLLLVAQQAQQPLPQYRVVT
jgi:hypothetical protein